MIAMSERSDLWPSLRRVLARFTRWLHKGRDQRRSVATRERFWAEARAGETEAADRTRT